ncbi:hypothetical protein EDD86DRAFT_207609 [Gorgonomyces haynaldii]|nr:hypothetical protein EDD86DRAFT_207609 [Gorgonomyces haynaldii]
MEYDDFLDSYERAPPSDTSSEEVVVIDDDDEMHQDNAVDEIIDLMSEPMLEVNVPSSPLMEKAFFEEFESPKSTVRTYHLPSTRHVKMHSETDLVRGNGLGISTQAKSVPNLVVDDFMPPSANVLSSAGSDTSIPYLTPPNSNYVSPYKSIIDKAAREQESAQMLFKNLQSNVVVDVPKDHLTVMDPSLAVPQEGEQRLARKLFDDTPMKVDQFHLPPPPSVPPPASLLKAKQRQTIHENPSKKRLESLGIFDIAPKPRSSVHIPTRDTSKVDLKSFVTPAHQKAQKVKNIDQITGPQLVSTSSTVRIIPIADILADLRASGRLKDD